jgi:hypothetical protein
MAHVVVKIIVDNDGAKKKGAKWCLSVISCGDPQTLCTGEYYGDGGSSCEYKLKKVERGGITCHECLSEIMWYKSIKL